MKWFIWEFTDPGICWAVSFQWQEQQLSIHFVCAIAVESGPCDINMVFLAMLNDPRKKCTLLYVFNVKLMQYRHLLNIRYCVIVCIVYFKVLDFQ